MWAFRRFLTISVFLIKFLREAVDDVSYLIIYMFVYIQKNESKDVEVEDESSSNPQQR